MKETRFKDTEIGRIPEDWEVTLIGDECSVNTGSRNTQDKIDDGQFPFYVRSQEIERINTYSYDCEAVLTAGDGVGTGKVFHYVNGKFEVHQRVYIMNEFSSRLDGRYLYRFFSLNFYNRIHQMTAKSSVDSVRKEMITKMPLVLPPVSEQSRIASALTSIDNLIASLDKLMEKKKNIKQGTMQQLLTGKKRLKGFTEPWVEKRIIDSFTFLSNNTYSRDELSDTGLVRNVHYGDVLIKYGATIDASRNVLPFVTGKETASHPLKDGDIIMADTAEDETCGKVCEIRGIGDSLIEAGLHTIALRPNDEYGRWFLGYYMNSSAFHDLLIPLMQGTKVTSISKSALLNVRMMIPSVKAEQTAIAKVLSTMDNDITALESKKAKCESIKQGMMQQLLLGNIRLLNK